MREEDRRRPTMDASRLDDLQRRIDSLRSPVVVTKPPAPAPKLTYRRPEPGGPLITLRRRRSWVLTESAAFAAVLLAYAVTVIHDTRLALALWLPTVVTRWWTDKAAKVEVYPSRITADPDGLTFRWDDITAVRVKRSGILRRRAEGLEGVTQSWTGRARRRFMALSPCEPNWRSTALLTLLREHRPDLDLGTPVSRGASLEPSG